MVYDVEVTWNRDDGEEEKEDRAAVGGGGGMFCISAEGTFCGASDNRCEQIENRLAF